MITRKQLRSKINVKSQEWEDTAYDFYKKLPKALQTDRLYTVLTFPTEDGFKFWVCQLLNSHEGTMDQCGMPEHDYCIYCGTRMAYQGENLEFRLKRRYLNKYCPDCKATEGYHKFCDAHQDEAKL